MEITEPMVLFDGDDAAFRAIVRGARVYGEYGVGASTEYVYRHTGARIVAVETSRGWAAEVARGKDRARLQLFWADLGPVGNWGYPLTYAKRGDFASYTDAIWQLPEKPDVVLIDGRFRVACFLTSLLHGDPGLTIVFDDYAGRPHYHLVEEFLAPRAACGRQAIFERPAKVDEARLRRTIEQFRMVRD